MASLQERRGWFHLLFRYRGKQHSHALKTQDRREAEAYRGTADRVLIRVRSREITSPAANVNLASFLLNGGNRAEIESQTETPAPAVLTLTNLRDSNIQPWRPHAMNHPRKNL